MHEEWTDLMSAAVDGELDPVTTRRLESHLAGCAECAAVMADLRGLIAAASSYQGVAPASDLWPGIKGRIDATKVLPFARRSRARFGFRELLAAGIVMAAAGAGGSWYWTHREPAALAVADRPVSGAGFELTSTAYDSALAELGRTLTARRGQLDTSTVRVLERSIRTIDQAVAEARAAIQRDTANAYLNEQIAANLRQKLNLLKAATRAINSAT